jgi:hypothetical protein
VSTQQIDDRRDETPDERADRNFGDLLQELRVSQTGVQILFSLLLTVPFSARFDEVTDVQKDVYVVALLLAASASVTLTAPVAYHRMLFHRGQKERLVSMSSRLAGIGLCLLLLAVTAVLLLITDVLFATEAAIAIAAVFGVLTAALWLVPAAWTREERS